MAETDTLMQLWGIVTNISDGTGKAMRAAETVDRASILVQNTTDGTEIEVTYNEFWDWREGWISGMDAVPCRVMGLADPVWWLEGLAAAMVEPKNADSTIPERVREGEPRAVGARTE